VQLWLLNRSGLTHERQIVYWRHSLQGGLHGLHADPSLYRVAGHFVTQVPLFSSSMDRHCVQLVDD
jgi:hypothetical protein